MSRIIYTALAVMIYQLCFSQDVITLLNDDEIEAKVTDITPSEVYYILPCDSGNQSKSIGKWLVQNIKYKNGTEDIEVYKDVKYLSLLSDSDICSKAKTDAGLYYDYSSPANTAFFVTLLLTPIIGGLATNSIIKSNPVEDDKLNIPENDFITNKQYQYCYRNEAIEIKRTKVMKSYIRASLTEVFVIVFFLFMHENK